MKNEDKKDEESEDEEEVGAKYQNSILALLPTMTTGLLNQRRICELLYVKSKIVSKKEGNIGVESHKLLHDDRCGCLGRRRGSWVEVVPEQTSRSC